MKRTSLLIFLTAFITIEAFCQSKEALYTPVTLNSPLFNRSNEIQIGASINNFGLNYSFAGQLKNHILIGSLQLNTGTIRFDPFNFNDYWEQGEETHLIQSKPSDMLYFELGYGYNYQHKTQKLSLVGGVGQQFRNSNTRFFMQFEWGNESELINAGVSLRANFTIVNGFNLFTLEPVVQGKVKIGSFRIVNQFGYSIAIKKDEDYMKPILTIGLQYIITNTAQNNDSGT